jgi:pilus assembly protein Flp/PilA
VASDDSVVQTKEKNWEWWGVSFKPESVMYRWLADFWSSESGATAIEYGLILVGISLTIIAAVNSVGTSIRADLSASATGINP